MNLGENIKKARKNAGVTQKELADRVGVYQKDVSRWETGEVIPSVESLADICRAIGASADAIMGLDR